MKDAPAEERRCQGDRRPPAPVAVPHSAALVVQEVTDATPSDRPTALWASSSDADPAPGWNVWTRLVHVPAARTGAGSNVGKMARARECPPPTTGTATLSVTSPEAAPQPVIRAEGTWLTGWWCRWPWNTMKWSCPITGCSCPLAGGGAHAPDHRAPGGGHGSNPPDSPIRRGPEASTTPSDTNPGAV